MSRYTLMYENNPIEGYTNVLLSDIDRMTLNFTSSREIVDKLKLKGFNLSSLRVYYNVNHERKSIDVALNSNAEILKKIILDSSNKIVLEDNFNIYVSDCINLAYNEIEYRDILYRSRISSKAKELIENYMINPTAFNLGLIKKEFSNYLQFRFLIQTLDQYKLGLKSSEERNAIRMKRFGAEVEEPTYKKGYEDTDRYKLDMENFTDDEIREYKDYLNSIEDGDQVEDFIPGRGRR